jgi:hypothetical protein
MFPAEVLYKKLADGAFSNVLLVCWFLVCWLVLMSFLVEEDYPPFYPETLSG